MEVEERMQQIVSSAKQKVQEREKANREILKYIESLIERFPQQRFGQILSNYILEKGVDPFYEESVDMLTRIKKGY